MANEWNIGMSISFSIKWPINADFVEEDFFFFFEQWGTYMNKVIIYMYLESKIK